VTDNNHENAGDQIILSDHQEQIQVLNDTSTQASVVPSKVREIAQKIHDDNTECQETVRTILTWFEAKRRGIIVINSIQNALAEVGLTTDPDFTSVYIDAEVRIISAQQIESNSVEIKLVEKDTDLPDATVEVTTEKFVCGAIEDPTFRIGKLESADNKPVSVSPDSMLIEATTLMMLHDFSHLPVMQGEREIKGVISWESIGKRQALKHPCEKVKDCMEILVPEVSAESSLFSAIDLIVKYGYVLVKQKDKKVSGIVTTTDLSLQFRQLAEPFLLIGEIEKHIRRLIDGKFTNEQLAPVQNRDENRTISTVSDLTFGEYLRLLEKPEYWANLQIPVDRAIFIKQLDQVRELRNDIMHFDPDPFEDKDIQMLRLFTNFMRILDIKKD
jgi:CBS domain-containing protein